MRASRNSSGASLLKSRSFGIFDIRSIANRTLSRKARTRASRHPYSGVLSKNSPCSKHSKFGVIPDVLYNRLMIDSSNAERRVYGDDGAKDGAI